MVASADNMRVAIVEEATIGSTPANPAFQLMRITGESLTFDVNTDQSPELSSAGSTQSRGQSESSLVGAVASGGVDFILHDGPAIASLMSAALASNWGNDPGTVGIGADQVYDSSMRRTFTLEKEFGLDGGLFAYHRYTGCTVDGMSLTVQPNSRITGSFSFQGSDLVTDDAKITGATYLPAGTDPVFTAALVPSITLKDSAGLTVFDLRTSCFSNLQINIGNAIRGIPCIGALGNRETAFGAFTCEIQFSVYLTSNLMLEALRDQTEYSLELILEDPNDEQYVFTFPRVVISSATANGGGSGEDVLVTGTFTPLLGAAPDEYVVLIEKRTAPAPAPITAVAAGAGAASTSATVTFGGGSPGNNTPGTLTVEMTPDGGTPVIGTLAITPTTSPLMLAGQLVAAVNGGTEFSATNVGPVVTIVPAGTTTNITDLTATIA